MFTHDSTGFGIKDVSGNCLVGPFDGTVRAVMRAFAVADYSPSSGCFGVPLTEVIP